jgi:hypothetical protein
VVSAGCLALALGLTGALTGATSAGASAPALVELGTCAAPTPLPASTAARSDGATRVSFQVPAVARLRLRSGRPSAAATNTGCAPRATDHFVVGERPATSGEVSAALATFRTGDWRTPGSWHPAG